MVKYNEGFQVTLWSCGKLPNKIQCDTKGPQIESRNAKTNKLRMTRGRYEDAR